MKKNSFVLLIFLLFTCLWTACDKEQVPADNEMMDSRDGETYATMIINGQTWMAENLRYNATGSWINPLNPSDVYGRLYEWTTIMNGETSSSADPSNIQGLCPNGWHLPSDQEWKNLEISLGLSVASADTMVFVRGVHGTAMKSTTGWNFGNGTNTSKFNAFPAGYYYSGSFSNLGEFTGFWSSTEYSLDRGIYRYLHAQDVGVFRDKPSKTFAFSCRCVKN